MIVAALGRTAWLYDAILQLKGAGHTIGLVGTCPAAPEYGVTEHDFADLAREIGCPYFCDHAINKQEYIRMVQDSGAQAGVSVNWLSLIGQEMIAQFPCGIINAHAGDLPRYRGNAVPNWAIINRESRVTVTLHQMVPKLDAGPILLKRSCAVTPDTYIRDLYDFLNRNIPEMFVEVIDGLADGSIVPQPQPDDPLLSLRCFPRMPRDGRIDWRRPAGELARLVHASSEPFAGAFTHRNSEKLVIWRARADRLPYPYLGYEGQVVSRSIATGEVTILTGEGTLVLQEVETKNQGRRKASDIIFSTRERLGMDLEEEILRLRRQVEQLEQMLTVGDSP